MFIGSYIFAFIGVLFKWLIQFPFLLIKKRKIKSFKEIWDGSDGNEPDNYFLHGFSNTFLGAVIVALILNFIIWMGW